MLPINTSLQGTASYHLTQFHSRGKHSGKDTYTQQQTCGQVCHQEANAATRAGRKNKEQQQSAAKHPGKPWRDVQCGAAKYPGKPWSDRQQDFQDFPGENPCLFILIYLKGIFSKRSNFSEGTEGQVW